MKEVKTYGWNKWFAFMLLIPGLMACDLIGKKTDYAQIIAELKNAGCDSLIFEYVSDYNFDVVALFRFGKSYSATDIFVFNADKSLKEYYFFPNDPEDTTRNAKALLVLKYRYEYGVNDLHLMEYVRPFAILMGDNCRTGESKDELPGIFFDSDLKSGEVFLLFPLPFLKNQRIVNFEYRRNYIGFEVGNFPLNPIDLTELTNRFQPSEIDSLFNLKIAFNYLSVAEEDLSISAYRWDFAIKRSGDCIRFHSPRYD